MKLEVSRQDVWAASIPDQPGGAGGKLSALAEAGANLQFVIARRAHEKPGKGVVFLTPLKGAKQIRAAKKAGFCKTESLRSVRVEGMDKPGLGARITEELACAGINLRGLSAAAIGRKFVAYLAFDNSDDAQKGARILKKMK